MCVASVEASAKITLRFAKQSIRGWRSREPLGDGAEKGGMEGDRKAAIHGVISFDEGWYVAECPESAVMTKGQSLDEALANLTSALERHLDGERLARAGLSFSP